MTQEPLFTLSGAGRKPGEGGTSTTPARPGWLEEVLIADLSWRRDAQAKLAECRKCGALTLHAADMGLDLCGESTVDPALLDRGLEVAALLAGRYTCEVEPSRHGGGPLLFRRDRWLIPKEPNARRRLWVPEHKCNQPLGYPVPLEVFYPAESRPVQEFTSPPF